MGTMRRVAIIFGTVFFLAAYGVGYAAGQPAFGPVDPESKNGARSESERSGPPDEAMKSPEQSKATAKTIEPSLLELHSEVERLSGELADLKEQLRNLHTRPPLTFFKPPSEVSLCGEEVPIKDRSVWENLDREFLLALSSEAQVILWMKRGRRYFPAIERRLKDLGLPDDLKYLTIIESSLRPSVVSSAGAAGIWQFIPSTGEKYGMRQNKGCDERLDFLKATDGALTYLSCLYKQFGNWALAMAAYNAGENRIQREIDFQRVQDYYRLLLPEETQRYVYKIAVAKIIISNPERYGFRLEEKEFYAPLQLERLQVELDQPLPLLEVARAVGLYYKEMKEMNPHFCGENIPAGVQYLNLPAGTSEKFWAFYSARKKELEAK